MHFWMFHIGGIPAGLVSHPDGQHIIYPLGCTVIVEDVYSHTQSFLTGHSNNVSCLACSASGAFLASGQVCDTLWLYHSDWLTSIILQVTHMGFKADVIVWQFHERSLYCRLSLHMVKVQAVSFSPNDKYLATLGGQDDNRCSKQPLVDYCSMHTSVGLVLWYGTWRRRRQCVAVRLPCRVQALSMPLHSATLETTSLSLEESEYYIVYKV